MHFERRPNVDEWLARVDTPPDDARRVRELLVEHIDDGFLTLDTIVVAARKSQK
jgi:hypothetical protein